MNIQTEIFQMEEDEYTDYESEYESQDEDMFFFEDDFYGYQGGNDV
jgi:hypothetical protein